MLEIVAINGLASVQDLGRFGLRRFGIGHSGAMDRLALQAGNLLLNNPENLAAIELYGGMQVLFRQDTSFVVTGALYQATLDQKPIYSYWRYTARKGQYLNLIQAKVGVFGYLCVTGGIDVPVVLGSRSTDSRLNIGGFNGRYLQVADCLPISTTYYQKKIIGIAPPTFQRRIRAVASSEMTTLTTLMQMQFWRTKWILSLNSNRMGYRLQGKSLDLAKSLEMQSHGVQFGTVQLPPQGEPIILMAESQTTGGYPKIAKVIEADLGSLAQTRFGTQFQFEQVSLLQAKQALVQQQQYLYQIKRIANEH